MSLAAVHSSGEEYDRAIDQEATEAALRADLAGDDGYTVNLTELADILDVSEPTLKRLMRANADFPIKRGGSNGVPYAFDARAVVAWWQAHEAAVAAEREQKADRAQQLRLELLGGVTTGEAQGLTGKQRLDELNAELTAMRVAKERGELLVKADVEQHLANAFTILRQEIQQVAPSASRAFTLSRDDRLKLEDMLATALRNAAKRLGAVI